MRKEIGMAVMLSAERRWMGRGNDDLVAGLNRIERSHEVKGSASLGELGD